MVNKAYHSRLEDRARGRPRVLFLVQLQIDGVKMSHADRATFVNVARCMLVRRYCFISSVRRRLLRHTSLGYLPCGLRCI